MKSSERNIGLVILGLAPIIYGCSYFAFLSWTQPCSVAPTPNKMITVITGKSKLAVYGAVFFRPALKIHQKATGRMVEIKFHEMA